MPAWGGQNGVASGVPPGWRPCGAGVGGRGTRSDQQSFWGGSSVGVSRQHPAEGLGPEEAPGGLLSAVADSDLGLALHSRRGRTAGLGSPQGQLAETGRLRGAGGTQPDGFEPPHQQWARSTPSLLLGTTSPVGGKLGAGGQGAAGCQHLSTCATGWVLGAASQASCLPSPTFPIPW